MKIEIINPLNYKNWDDLLISNPNYSFFYTSFWAKVLCESYKYNPIYFSIIQNNRLLALIPILEIKSIITGKRGVSLPFSDYCEPLVNDKKCFSEIINYIYNFGKSAGWKFFELRGGNNFQTDKEENSLYYVHYLDLKKNEEQLFSNFKNNTKRNIRKAIREGVKVSICNSEESVKEFYKLNCITRKIHGLPPQPYYFFQNIFQFIILKEHGFIVLAKYSKKVIAGAIFFHFGKKVIYKYGASNRKYQQLRANNLVMWEAIKWALYNKFKIFSFGRTRPSNNGLLQFKGGWGSRIETVKYYRYNIKHNNEKRNKIQSSDRSNLIFKKLPVPLLKIIGYIFYRHIG